MPSAKRIHPSGGTFSELLVIVSILLIIGILLTAILRGRKPEAQESPVITVVTPIDEGNGIFYFPVTGESYRRSLAAFYKSEKSQHCDLQGFTEKFNRGGAGSTVEITGFILHCHDIAVEAQSITVP